MKVKEKLLHTFIADFIDEDSIVLDLGGNKGEFSKFIVDEFRATAYVIEPIPELFNQIPEHPKIKKFQYCISKKKMLKFRFLRINAQQFMIKILIKKLFAKV
jgi:hypothetical protein